MDPNQSSTILNNKMGEYKTNIETQERKLHYYETRVTNLCIFYIFFLAIMFLSIFLSNNNNNNNILHENWWIPFCFTFLVAIIFFTTISSEISKWARTRYEFDFIKMEKDLIFGRMLSLDRRINIINSVVDPEHTIGSTLSTLSDASRATTNVPTNIDQQIRPLKPDMFEVYRRYAYTFVVVSALLVSTIQLLYACSALHAAANSQAN